MYAPCTQTSPADTVGCAGTSATTSLRASLFAPTEILSRRPGPRRSRRRAQILPGGCAGAARFAPACRRASGSGLQMAARCSGASPAGTVEPAQAVTSRQPTAQTVPQAGQIHVEWMRASVQPQVTKPSFGRPGPEDAHRCPWGHADGGMCAHPVRVRSHFDQSTRGCSTRTSVRTPRAEGAHDASR